MKFARLPLALFLLCFAGAALARAADWYALSPDAFARRPEVQERIEPANFRNDLLAAAIFHEANRQRTKLGLPVFAHVAKLDEAADLKATMGVVELTFSHTSALPLTATPADRVQYVGLDYSRVAENIARLAAYDLPGDVTTLGVRERNGISEFYRLDTGRPPEMQTYAGFAAKVVASWMKSPGHRENLVNPLYTSLGCAARPCRGLASGQQQIYAVQVFFTPSGKSPRRR